MAISEKNRQIKGFHALIIFARKVGIHTFPPSLFLSSCLLSLFQIFFSYSLNVEKSTFRGNELKTIPLCSAFFVVQLSHPYMTTGKTRSLTIKTFVDKVMSLLFNMLSRFVIAFLSESKGL